MQLFSQCIWTTLASHSLLPPPPSVSECLEPSVDNEDYTVTWDSLQLDKGTLTFTCPDGKVTQNLTTQQLFPCTAAGWQSDDPLPCDSTYISARCSAIVPTYIHTRVYIYSVLHLPN